MPDKIIPIIKAKKKLRKDVILDPEGFFIIELFNDEIKVEYYKNVYRKNKIVSGVLKKIFIGKKADALCDTIADNIDELRKGHFMYLGREIYKAEICLKENKKYIQGGC